MSEPASSVNPTTCIFFYADPGQEAPVSLQRIRILDQVLVEIKLNIVDDNGVRQLGMGCLRRIGHPSGFGSKEGIIEGVVWSPPRAIGGLPGVLLWRRCVLIGFCQGVDGIRMGWVYV